MEETLEVEARPELLIEIDLYDTGYDVSYLRLVGESYAPFTVSGRVTRAEMVAKHISVIRELAPKRVAVVTGKHSTGHLKELELTPGVVRSIVEKKLTAAELTL